MNIWIAGYMRESTIHRPRFRNMSEEQRILVMESRTQDLENIRLVSLYSVFPLIVLSFGGGYLLSTLMLRPLGKLNAEIRKKELNNLDEEIVFEDRGDEISELIKGFNLMSRRLGKSFESQKQFVENASHEMKTPLAVIQANLDTALGEGKISRKELNILLQNSKSQISLMDNLMEDLFLLSHMTSNASIKMEEIEVFDLIHNVVDMLESLSREKGFEIILKSHVNGTEIKGNRILLERALSNIVENSIKYSKGDRIRIVVERDKRNVLIYVIDNGKGIPAKYQRDIFQRFFRIDKGRSRKEGGSGLGLAITKEIVERHGGNISLDCKYNKGSKFKIVLPRL
jgi:signal transduction histidine kinase